MRPQWTGRPHSLPSTANRTSPSKPCFTRPCPRINRNRPGKSNSLRDGQPEIAEPMINALTILFCLTLIYLAVTTRLSAYVLILVLQGGLVAGVHTLAFFRDFSWSHVVVAAGVLLVRTILIPAYIMKIIRELD